MSIVGFSKVGADAKVMICDMDDHCFEVTYFGGDGMYYLEVYSHVGWEEFNEEDIAMAMKDHQYCYSEKSNDASTSHVQIEDDKIQTSIVDKIQLSDETKCPICQEHHNFLGLTEAFELRIKEDILFLKDNSVRNDMRFPKDAFKIKYCPFCGRKL